MIPIQKINEAYERMLKSDVKYRFSIDMARYRARHKALVSALFRGSPGRLLRAALRGIVY